MWERILDFFFPRPHANEAGLALIRKFETLKLTRYKDVNGAWKIGYGSPAPKDVSVISSDEAENLLKSTLKPMENAVFRAIKVPVSPDQYSALLSLTYNIGVTEFLKSHLLGCLNRGDYRGAADEFLRWIHCRDPISNREVISQDLLDRRTAERALFLEFTPLPAH